MSEKTSAQDSNPEHKGVRKRTKVLIGASALAIASVAVTGGVKNLAEMPTDTYSSMEGVQVTPPSNPFQWAARKITGVPEIDLKPGNLEQILERTNRMRGYGNNSDEAIQAAVNYAVKENPDLLPYKDQRVPGGETIQIPLLPPEVVFVNQSKVPVVYSKMPGSYRDATTGAGGQRDQSIQDAIATANAESLWKNDGSWPEEGMYHATVASLTDWVGDMPNMTEYQKSLAATQAVNLLQPPLGLDSGANTNKLPDGSDAFMEK